MRICTRETGLRGKYHIPGRDTMQIQDRVNELPQEVFERHADAYDDWFVVHREVYHAECERIRQSLPAPDARTIEVGVGSGRFAVPLGIPLGIEPSAALGQMARRRGIEVIHGVGEFLPLKNGSCSSVLMVTVICFFDDPARAFAEAYRVLVPGGVLVAGFLERGGTVIQAYLHGDEGHRFLSQGRFYTSEEVVALLQDAGFSIRSAETENDFCVIVVEKIPYDKIDKLFEHRKSIWHGTNSG